MLMHDGRIAGEMTIGEPRPKSLRSPIDLGLGTDGGFVGLLLAGVSSTGAVYRSVKLKI